MMVSNYYENWLKTFVLTFCVDKKNSTFVSQSDQSYMYVDFKSTKSQTKKNLKNFGVGWEFAKMVKAVLRTEGP